MNIYPMVWNSRENHENKFCKTHFGIFWHLLFFDYAHSNFSSTKESSYKIQQRGEGEVEPDKTNLSGLNGLNDECQVGKAHHFSPFVLVVFRVEEGVGPQDTLGQLSWFWTWSQDLGTKEI